MNQSKLEPRLYEHIFIGYYTEYKPYRLYNPNSRKVITSRDVRFIDEFQNHLPSVGIELLFPTKDENSDSRIEEVTSFDSENP